MPDDTERPERRLPLERTKTDRYLLTERARSDDALANRDDFVGIVSHDLRNLLEGIVMSAGMLAKMADSHEQGKQVLAGTARIQRYAARMNRLIGDLLDVASIDSGNLAVAKVPGDLAAVGAEAVEMFSGEAEAKQITLDLQLGPGPLAAAFDHDRVLRALTNLLSNAIKFTPDSGTVGLRIERSTGAVDISVIDTGPGIPVEMRESVFERFWQIKENDVRGLGLGLYISRTLVNAHGGTLRVESSPGAGSRFVFTPPAAA